MQSMEYAGLTATIGIRSSRQIQPLEAAIWLSFAGSNNGKAPSGILDTPAAAKLKYCVFVHHLQIALPQSYRSCKQAGALESSRQYTSHAWMAHRPTFEHCMYSSIVKGHSDQKYQAITVGKVLVGWCVTQDRHDSRLMTMWYGAGSHLFMKGREIADHSSDAPVKPRSVFRCIRAGRVAQHTLTAR